MIEIADLQRKVKIPVARLRRLVRGILAGERTSCLHLSFAFVTNRAIRVINRKFLGHDYATDVISFALENPGSAGGVHGEVVISTDYARSEAKKRSLPVEEELLRYVAHGTLHLLGYDDHRPADRRKMWKKQEGYLSECEGRRAKREARRAQKDTGKVMK